MTGIDPKRVQAVFLEAVEAADDAARRALLDRACGGDFALRARVDELLEAHESSGAFLAEPIVQPIAPDHDLAEPPAGNRSHQCLGATTQSETASAEATVAGRYRLVERIGEGGMGAVWVAEQREPVKRLVALKLIKPGMDSRQVLARFEAERQALAMMDHPNIAKVFDGGATDAGHPYFVMEHVKGVPITEYCDERRLSLRDRLLLFVQVCQAVQHAHQKGIIHRDLKPSNVLVCLYDGVAVPKVIDFGLAKAMHQPLTEHTLYTAHGLVMGTPLYMSPEQAEFNNLDIDTRSDVYSLGVILYELLTGTTPLEKQQFKEQAWQEIVRLIKEEEPPRPSTKLSRSGSLPVVAAQRSLEPVQLSRAVRGDLDWIVMKALEKERSRRYDTAAGLARDIDRYLRDEPVEACPPSTGYRLKKLMRRNQGLFVAGTAVLLALIAGVVGTTLGLIEARRQEGIAIAAAVEEKLARKAEARRAEAEGAERKRAEAAEKLALERLQQVTAEKFRADRSLEVARAVNAFMANDILGQADSRAQADGNFAPNPDLKVRTAIDRAAEKVGRAFADKPMIEAAIRRTIGDAYEGIGDYPKAVEQLERAAELLKENSGSDDRNTLSTLSNLVGAYRGAGRTNEAIALGESLCDAWTRVAGPDSDELLATLATLGLAYRAESRTAEAISALERVLAITSKKVGDRHHNVCMAQNNLALAYMAAGRFSQAVRLAEQARDGFVKLLGPEHPDTLSAKLALGQALRGDRKPADAIAIFEPLQDSLAKTRGANHPVSLIAQHSLASAYIDVGRSDEAIAIADRVQNLRREILGASHPDTFAIQLTLARAYYRGGKTTEALALLEQLRAEQEAKLGAEHPDVVRTGKFLAEIRSKAGRTDAEQPGK